MARILGRQAHHVVCNADEGAKPREVDVPLSRLIELVNERFGTDFNYGTRQLEFRFRSGAHGLQILCEDRDRVLCPGWRADCESGRGSVLV